MAWWKSIDGIADNYQLDEEEDNILQDYEKGGKYALSDEETDMLYRDREELVAIGHDLYVEIMTNTSNKGDKDKIRQQYQTTNEKFTDPQFKPESASLIADWSMADFNTQKLWKTFVWKRSDEIFKQPIKVFNNIDPNDILQGNLGNCYFLSVLSAIAEFPKRIEKLFDTQEYQPSGCYTVNICDLGVWTDYVVDDHFPCTKDGQIAFSGPHFQEGVAELWVLLLEKAWAKRFGSYYAIDAGMTEDVLRDLTGGPCEIVMHDDPNIWEKVFDANAKNFIITAASSGEEGCGDLVNEMGLVSLHAYAVIDAQEVEARHGSERILMIRNPWGQQEWTGDWSDNSSKWTPELKAQLNWESSDDGRFWMSIEDFCHYFSNVTICRVHDNYFYEGMHLTQSVGLFNVIEVRLSNPGNTYFIVTQNDSRRYGEESGYEYYPVRIIVARKEGKSLSYVKGKANAYARDVWIECELEAGDYAVYVEIDWDGTFTDQLGFSCYSESSIELKNITYQYPDFVQKAYNLALAKEESQEKEIGAGIY
jgi:hypothetical protein